MFGIEPSEHFRPLNVGTLQSVHIQAKCCQNSRRQLSRANLFRELGLLEFWVAEEARDHSVVVAKTTVFGDLGFRGCVNDTEIGADDDVGNSSVVERVTEPFSDETLSENDIVDFQCSAGVFKVIDSGLCVTLVPEEDESDIISLSTIFSFLVLTMRRRYLPSGTKQGLRWHSQQRLGRLPKTM